MRRDTHGRSILRLCRTTIRGISIAAERTPQQSANLGGDGDGCLKRTLLVRPQLEGGPTRAHTMRIDILLPLQKSVPRLPNMHACIPDGGVPFRIKKRAA